MIPEILSLAILAYLLAVLLRARIEGRENRKRELAESIKALEWELELRDTDKPRTPQPKAPKPGELIR